MHFNTRCGEKQSLNLFVSEELIERLETSGVVS